MKRVLVTVEGNVQDIKNPGEEYQIYEGPGAAVRWINCQSDNVNSTWIMVDGQWLEDVQAPPSYDVLRRSAYGDIGDQLDMLYKDMLNGTQNWVDHISTVKEVVPGVNSEEAQAMYASRPPIKWGTVESPAWTDSAGRVIPGLVYTKDPEFCRQNGYPILP
jgi:hypothetical protein